MLSTIFSGWMFFVVLCVLAAPLCALIEFLSHRKHVKSMRKYQPDYCK